MIAVACVEPIVMDPMEEMPVVVQCVLQREGFGYGPTEQEKETPVQYLDLYYARRPSESAYRVIDDAKVKVTGGGETHWFQWDGARWACAFQPGFGVTYELSVTLADNTSLRATTTFPECLQLQSISLHEPVTDMLHSGKYWFIRHNNQTSGQVLSTGKIHSDIRMKVYEGECFLWVEAFQDGQAVTRLCTSHRGVDDFNVCPGSGQDLKTFRIYEKFEKGERGLDAVGNVSDPDNEEKEHPWRSFVARCRTLPMHLRFLRIHHPALYDSGMGWDILYPAQYNVYLPYVSHQDAEGNTYNVLTYTENGWMELAPARLFTLEADATTGWDVPNAHFAVRFLSPEYDHYLRDVLKNTFVHAEEFAQMYSTEEVYTNIQGGVGFFGCQWHARDVWY